MNICARALYESLKNRSRVAAVIDGEVFVVPESLALAAQDSNAGRVKGLDPHAFGAFAKQVAHTLAHLRGCLVGEGDGKNLAWPGFFVGEQVGYAVSQNPGLARTGTGHNQQGWSAVLNGSALLRV